MAKAQRTFRTGDAVGQQRASAHEIDRLLSELSHLYLEHVRTLRTGDFRSVQIVIDKISILKMKLEQL